ncbi:MAG TPA: hypothetical protein VJW51_06325 [Candidatus Acidoferrales bacterium]|nr:hypothetical protein [Candidatus Acidoferrales bacterium]
MRDFSLIVRRRLGRLPLEPSRAHEISTELAHQLEDRFQDSIERGLPEARALADALEQFGDWEKVRRAILSAELGENNMWPQPSAVSRRASWAALAIVALLCLAPSFRQALRAAPEAWSVSRQPLSEGTLRGVAERGFREHDASLAAFAALHLQDLPGASRYAEQAIAMDPKLTWIATHFANPVDSNPAISKAWMERLTAWDPDNAVPYLFAAELLYARSFADGSLDDAAALRLANTTAWGEKMRAAFAAPRFDNYSQRRFELDRSVLRRLRVSETDALLWYASGMGFVNLSEVSAYAGLITRKLGPQAEQAGHAAEAAALYWSVARFGERVGNGASWEWERVIAANLEESAYASLAGLADRTGKKDEAAALSLLSERAERASSETRAAWGEANRTRWALAERPAMLAWVASGLVLLSAIACLAWAALLGFRSEDRVLSGWLGGVALGLSYAPIVLLASSAVMYTAMLPYLRSAQEFATGRELANTLAPFWFSFRIGLDPLGDWRVYAQQLLVPGMFSLAVLITGIAALRWMARHRAGQTPQAG